MKTIHVFENGLYKIGNKAVSKCFLFKEETDCERFKLMLDKQLSPLCDILAYKLTRDEFQLVIKLKSREVFKNYYIEKYDFGGDFIPESTYIFAQSMANLQSGYAKYFNYKYERDGGLMRGRYSRELIESEELLDSAIKNLHEAKNMIERRPIWTFRRRGEGFDFEELEKGGVRNSSVCYMNGGFDSGLECFMPKDKLGIRGLFKNIPPKRISFENKREKVRNLLAFMFLRLEI